MDSPVCIYGTKYVDVQQYTPVKGPGGFSNLESRIYYQYRGAACLIAAHRWRARFPTKFFVVRVSRTASTPTHRLDRERLELLRETEREKERESEKEETGVFTHSQFYFHFCHRCHHFSLSNKHPPPALWAPIHVYLVLSQRSPVPTYIPVFYGILVPRFVPLCEVLPYSTVQNSRL
jgi:hypothetical protein